MTLPDSFAARHAEAVRRYQAGDYPQAEQLCRGVLDRDGDFAPAWHLLGLIALRRGQNESAIEVIGRAVALAPRVADYHTHLAEAYRTSGRIQEAILTGRHAVHLKPDSPAAHNNLGLALHEVHKLGEAEKCFREAIRQQPGYARAHYNLGNTLRAECRLDEAAASLLEALRIQPGYVQAINALGVVLQEQGRHDEAVARLQEAVRVRPDYAAAYMNLGNALQLAERFSEAVAAYQAALKLRDDYYEAWLGLGGVFERLRRFGEATSAYRRAVELKPEDVTARARLASVYYSLSRFEEAVSEYQRIFKLQPDYTEALGNYERSRAELCDWTDRDRAVERLRTVTAERIAAGKPAALTPSQAHAFPLTAAEQAAIARSASQRISQRLAAMKEKLGFTHQPGPRERLRIGYLSCDFRNHAVSHLCAGVFALHDRERFEVSVYSYGPDDGSDYRRRIESGADRFVDVMNLSDGEAARRIHEDGIDILVEMTGHTGNGRLEIAALRPAPVQVHFLGFPATTGADFIDYFITDRVCTPPEEDAQFSESLVYMPHCYQVNDNEQPIPRRRLRRSRHDLPDGGFVFCSFNNTYKFDPEIFDRWMRILRAVDGSVLWLLETSPRAKENLRQEATDRSVNPSRLIFAERLPKPEHLVRHRLADLFLDSTVCNAHTSASDALWGGLPLLTCPGGTFATRVAASLLTALGLTELIVPNLSDYEHKAVRLARRPNELRRLRQRLKKRRQTSPLFDTPRYVRNLERAYEAMWRRYESGQPPEAIFVEEPRS